MSKFKIELPCNINEKLEVIPIDMQSYKQSLLSLRNSNKNGMFMISIVKMSKSRSLNQSHYYYGVVIKTLVQANIGYTTEEIHFLMTEKFLSYTKVINNQKLKFIRSTASLTTVEMEEYLSKVRAFASEFFSIFIPLPNETGYNC